jgi:hypothetical protein
MNNIQEVNFAVKIDTWVITEIDGAVNARLNLPNIAKTNKESSWKQIK